MNSVAYTQQLLDMEDLFGTSANGTVGIYFKKVTQVEIGYGLLNVAYYFNFKVLFYFFLLIW